MIWPAMFYVVSFFLIMHLDPHDLKAGEQLLVAMVGSLVPGVIGFALALFVGEYLPLKRVLVYKETLSDQVKFRDILDFLTGHLFKNEDVENIDHGYTKDKTTTLLIDDDCAVKIRLGSFAWVNLEIYKFVNEHKWFTIHPPRSTNKKEFVFNIPLEMKAMLDNK